MHPYSLTLYSYHYCISPLPQRAQRAPVAVRPCDGVAPISRPHPFHDPDQRWKALPEVEKAVVKVRYMNMNMDIKGLTPLPASGPGEMLASAPSSAPCLPPAPSTTITAVTVLSEEELNRILQEQLGRLRSSWSHESAWHCSR